MAPQGRNEQGVTIVKDTGYLPLFLARLVLNLIKLFMYVSSMDTLSLSIDMLFSSSCLYDYECLMRLSVCPLIILKCIQTNVDRKRDEYFITLNI